MSEQFSLPFPERRRPHHLFFALQPPAETAGGLMAVRDRIVRMEALAGRVVSRRCLHLSLHAIADCHGLSTSAVDAARRAGDLVSAAGFDLIFDRVGSFRAGVRKCPLVLRTQGDMSRLAGFHRSLGEVMKRTGCGRHVNSRFTPHVTLMYADRMIADRMIAPLIWRVTEFVLVDSWVGESHHRALARWPLRD